jgi:hypothetical protein
VVAEVFRVAAEDLAVLVVEVLVAEVLQVAGKAIF